VASAGGLFAERFALCQALLLERLAALTEALRGSGYRPVSVRPWGEEGEFVAVVWTRDGRDWRLEANLSLVLLKERDAHWQKAGLISADVAAYPSRDGDHYLALWRRGEAGEKAVLYAGVPNERHNAEQDVFKGKGYLPGRVQGLVSGDGVVRYAGVWRQGPGMPQTARVDWGDPEPAYAGRVLEAENLRIDVDVGPAVLLPYRPWLLDRLKQATAASQARPDDLAAAYQRATVLADLGRDEEALKVLDALLAGGKYPPAYRDRALLHARAGRAEQARSDLALFVRSGPDQARILSTKAVVAIYLGETERALEELDQAVESGSTSGVLYEAARAHAQAARMAQVRQAAWAAARAAAPGAWSSLAIPPRWGAEAPQAQRALALLDRALSGGYRDFPALQTDGDLTPLNGLPGLRDVLLRHGTGRHYASVGHLDSGREAKGPYGLTPDAHLARCRELAGQGWRPVALSLAAVPGERAPVAASVWHRPTLKMPEQEHLARRQATAALTLLHLGEGSSDSSLLEPVWPLFRHSPDPTVRSYLIQHAGLFGADPGLLIHRLEVEKDVSARRGLILALGEYTDRQLPARTRKPLVEKLLGWYRDDPDAGVHGAIDWLLRHGKEGKEDRRLDWGQGKELERIDRELEKPPSPPLRRTGVPPVADTGETPVPRQWYVNGQGQTFTLIRGPVEFRMGSPHTDPDWHVSQRAALRRIARSFALASKPVTVEQWQLFLKDRPDLPQDYQKRYSPEPGCPINTVSWYLAAAYCNWLSEKEGIPKDQWCYPDRIGDGMKPFPDYLKRTGYRLPTEAEWEYACRAQATTIRSFGSSLELLPRYAIFLGNSDNRTWPVGQKRPNDLGLFDLHGNVWQWCQEPFLYYPRTGTDAPSEDAEDIGPITDSGRRMLRSAACDSNAALVRAAFRIGESPTLRGPAVGVRPARTYP
jgi:formylglycine-generating enzyme required for sulfatase activity/tetratricopeptide (TPR) repeat protein